MNKNVIILIIILLMLICLSVIVEICIYGNEAMFIADYMPGPGMENQPSFEIVRAKALLVYIIPIFTLVAGIKLFNQFAYTC